MHQSPKEKIEKKKLIATVKLDVKLLNTKILIYTCFSLTAFFVLSVCYSILSCRGCVLV